MLGKEGKRGQVTIFIIIAIIVVALVVLIYLFYPQISGAFGFGEKSPQIFLETCLQEEIESTIETISLQGGSLNPEHTYTFNNSNVEYLCYTNEYYLTCAVQQPLLKKHVEGEIKSAIQTKVSECFTELENNFRSRGYGVALSRGDFSVELLPKRVVLVSDTQLTLTKDSTDTYNEFRVILNNNLYELTSIANSIVNWEATYGDAETTTYMNYYHDLKVEKYKQGDGTTIYVLTDRNTGNKFQFASRSVAWPPGYGA